MYVKLFTLRFVSSTISNHLLYFFLHRHGQNLNRTYWQNITQDQNI